MVIFCDYLNCGIVKETDDFTALGGGRNEEKGTRNEENG
jgi:hypothetical protein